MEVKPKVLGPCLEGAHHWVIEGSVGKCRKCSQTRSFHPVVQEAHPWVPDKLKSREFE